MVGNHYRSFDAQHLGGIGNAPPVVPAGCSDHTSGPFFRGQLEDPVQSSPDLEGMGQLHALRFHIDLAAQQGIQSVEMEQGSVVHIGGQTVSGLKNLFKGQHGKDLLYKNSFRMVVL